MSKEYVSLVEGKAYRVTGSRVSLDSIVYSFREGLSPESIVDCFPTLSLEQVYGAITFYLANQPMVDEYIKEGDRISDELWVESQKQNPDLSARIKKARLANPISG